MKSFLILLFIISCITLSAQDTIQRVKLPELKTNRILSSNRLVNKTQTTSQKIEARINSFLDSMVRTADANPFFIPKVKVGINNILNDFWRSGLLISTSKQEQAFFVLCNAQTMTSKDIADGRLVVIVGYALLKPAEFETRRFERKLINKTPLQYASQF